MLIQQEAPPWAGRTDDDFRDEFGTDFRDAYHDGFGDQPTVDPILDDPGQHPERRRTVVVHQRPGGPKVVEGTLVEQPSDPTLPRRATPTPRTPSEDPVDPDATLDRPAGEQTTTTAAAGLDDAYLDPADLAPRPRSEQPADAVPDRRPDEPTRPVGTAPDSRTEEPTPPVDAPGPEATPVASRSEPSPSNDGPAPSAEPGPGTGERTDTPTSAAPAPSSDDPTVDSNDPTIGSDDPTVPIDTIVPPTAPAPGQRTDEPSAAARTTPPPRSTEPSTAARTTPPPRTAEPSTAARPAPTTSTDDPDFDPIDLALDDPAPDREHPDTDSDVGADHLDAAIFGYAPEDPGADSPDLDTGAPIAGVGITVLVTDLDRSLEFYRDVLGFTEVDRGSGNAVLASGTTRLVLREVSEAAPISRRLVHVNLEVNDIQAAYERLRDTGLRFTYAPRVVNRGTKLEVWAAAFRDPDGHGIALTQWRALTGA
ncbi:VOC family protein [Micromonospora sp. NPDC000207]|uniref:VOC family protein n=1 Tax=Micromonospora sp. NPDC000207 TaxID=3154246 RepID=UPI0033221DD8